jgi:hypothetical protein
MSCGDKEWGPLNGGERRAGSTSWPDRRIDGLWGYTLLSSSNYGRGFGSVFHHQSTGLGLISEPFFFARFPSENASCLRTAAYAEPPNSAVFVARTVSVLCQPQDCPEATPRIHAGFRAVSAGVRLVGSRESHSPASSASGAKADRGPEVADGRQFPGYLSFSRRVRLTTSGDSLPRPTTDSQLCNGSTVDS